MNNFRAIANQARKTRSIEDTLALIEEYAKSGCAMYPADIELIGLVFGFIALENQNGWTANYVFHKCVDYAGDSYMVARAEAPNGKLTVADGCEGLS
jgi:hypothetical protein